MNIMMVAMRVLVVVRMENEILHLEKSMKGVDQKREGGR